MSGPNQESYGFWLRDLYQVQQQGVSVTMSDFDGSTVVIRVKSELVTCDSVELNVLRGAAKRLHCNGLILYFHFQARQQLSPLLQPARATLAHRALWD